jgi:hypothetical protein
MANGLWRVQIDQAKLQRDIARIAPQMKADAEKEAEKAAQSFARTVKRTAPKGEGPVHIADTVQVERGDPTVIERMVTIGDAAADYMAPLEFGHVTASGSLVPGARWWTPAKKIFAKRWKAALRRVAKRAFKQF